MDGLGHWGSQATKQRVTASRYLPLLRQLDQWQARANAEHPNIIPCRSGCSACCHGPFDISVADVALVVEAVRRLDRHVSHGVVTRAWDAVAAIQRFEPGWQPPFAIADLGDERFDQISDQLADQPCPLLGSQGECLIYHDRPMVCRIMGLGLVTESAQVLENGCPIQADYPVYATLPPQPFALEQWETEEEDAKIAAAVQLFGEVRWVGFETTIAGAIAGRFAPGGPSEPASTRPTSTG